MSNLKEQFNKFIDSLPERVNETPKKVVWEFIEKAIQKEKEAMAKVMIGREETPANKGFFMWCQGYNKKRQELLKYCKYNKLNIE